MAVNEDSLQAKYNLVKLNVLTSNQISNRTSAVITHLSPSSHAADTGSEVTDGVARHQNGRPNIVVLTAKSRAANKLISIVEIAKRELATKGVNCFQYTALSSEIVDIERKSRKLDESDSDSDDEAFETMGAIKLPEKKKRSMPIITVYLARSSSKELKAAYGEQT